MTITATSRKNNYSMFGMEIKKKEKEKNSKKEKKVSWIVNLKLKKITGFISYFIFNIILTAGRHRVWMITFYMPRYRTSSTGKVREQKPWYG